MENSLKKVWKAQGNGFAGLFSNIRCRAAYLTGNCISIDGGQSLADNPFNRLA
ncbi:MAG TPA: hypothetical protein VGB26_09260 [Nitrospiria bacterium]|jgi:hypothetical protein